MIRFTEDDVFDVYNNTTWYTVCAAADCIDSLGLEDRRRKKIKRRQKLLKKASRRMVGVTFSGRESLVEIQETVHDRVSGSVGGFILTLVAPFIVRWVVAVIVEYILKRWYFEGVHGAGA